MNNTKQPIKPFLCIIFFVLSITLGFYYGEDIKKDSFIAISSYTTNVAAILFGVIGAWIAIIYPTTLKKLLDENETNPDEEFSKLRDLYTPVYISSYVLITQLACHFTSAIIESNINDPNAIDILKRLYFAYLCSTSTLLIIATILCLLPFYNADSYARKILRNRKTKSKTNRSGTQ